MLSYAALMLATCIVETVLFSVTETQFLDCSAGPGLLRKCCISDQLPKGCECYDISSESGFTNSFFNKPQCPEEINVIFYLYNRLRILSPQIIKAGQANIKSTSYNGFKKTVFIAHGFTDNGKNSSWILDMKNALLLQEDINVVLVDWQQGAKGPNYNQATANTRTVGSMVARLILDLNTYAFASYGNFHLIGHSLGAQLMGYAGKEVFRLTNQKVGRISGLDPAGPNFEGYSSTVRIDSTDALFVDIIHTNGASLANGGFGMKSSVGHVDFYPNGGVIQPGCPTNPLSEFQSFSSIVDNVACSHGRVVEYFTNSIQRCRYNPPDGNTACTMGYYVSRTCKGNVYLTTTGTAPYCP